MQRKLSIPVEFVHATLANTARAGLDANQLLITNRISPRLLLETNARISMERFADLQAHTMVAMNDESLGYHLQPLPLGTWEMMCHATLSAHTLLQALQRFCRFYQLFGLKLRVDTRSSQRQITVSIDSETLSQMNSEYLAHSLLFHCHRYLSWLGNAFVPIHSATLNAPQRFSQQDYHRMFLGAPVRFSDQAELRLNRRSLMGGIEQNELSLRHYLRHPMLIMLTQSHTASGWAGRVYTILRRQINAPQELNAVADELQIHPQTLRRRLDAEGTSFSEIRAFMRRDFALHLLGKQGLSIEEIAYRTGFSESSAFIRAFKTWTGVTPYTYRKGL